MRPHHTLSAKFFVLILLVVGCSNAEKQMVNESKPANLSGPEGDEGGEVNTPEGQEVSNELGGYPSITKWLESVRGNTLRVPVVIKYGGLGIESSTLCSSIETESKGQRLRLDDSALGIPLTDSIRNLVDEQTGKCFVWLEGKSGTLLSPSSTADERAIKADEPHDFTVYKFLGAVERSPAVPNLSK